MEILERLFWFVAGFSCGIGLICAFIMGGRYDD